MPRAIYLQQIAHQTPSSGARLRPRPALLRRWEALQQVTTELGPEIGTDTRGEMRGETGPSWPAAAMVMSSPVRVVTPDTSPHPPMLGRSSPLATTPPVAASLPPLAPVLPAPAPQARATSPIAPSPSRMEPVPPTPVSLPAMRAAQAPPAPPDAPQPARPSLRIVPTMPPTSLTESLTTSLSATEMRPTPTSRAAADPPAQPVVAKVEPVSSPSVQAQRTPLPATLAQPPQDGAPQRAAPMRLMPTMLTPQTAMLQTIMPQTIMPPLAPRASSPPQATVQIGTLEVIVTPAPPLTPGATAPVHAPAQPVAPSLPSGSLARGFGGGFGLRQG